MSSLAAARADNFWIPNDPEHLTAYAGKAPGNLGARAKKQDQGILVIRYAASAICWEARLNSRRGACGAAGS